MARAYSNRFRLNVTEFSLPSWVPAQGQFANISLNTLASVRPSGWPSTDVAGPFANWSGGVRADDFSTLGAYVVYGSGHLSADTPVWAGVGCFDLDTRLWVMRNVPSAPLLERQGTDYNEYGESIVPGTEGHPYPPHTYDGLIYQPAAFGGGANGSLIRNFFAGSGWKNAVHRFDLSSLTNPPTRVIDAVSFDGSVVGAYPMTARDDARGGYWVLRNNGNGPLKFISFADWSETQYPAVGYNTYGSNTLVYLPAPYDCLLGFGATGGGGVNWGYWVCPIVGDVPQGFTQITPTGTPPNVGSIKGPCGGVWSTLLSRVVSYEAAGSYDVHMLTPPAPEDILTGTWAWSSETLTGAAGATPSRNTVSDNGAWGRMIEFPRAKCFIFCDGVEQPVQAWRLTGMS